MKYMEAMTKITENYNRKKKKKKKKGGGVFCRSFRDFYDYFPLNSASGLLLRSFPSPDGKSFL